MFVHCPARVMFYEISGVYRDASIYLYMPESQLTRLVWGLLYWPNMSDWHLYGIFEWSFHHWEQWFSWSSNTATNCKDHFSWVVKAIDTCIWEPACPFGVVPKLCLPSLTLLYMVVWGCSLVFQPVFKLCPHNLLASFCCLPFPFRCLSGGRSSPSLRRYQKEVRV